MSNMFRKFRGINDKTLNSALSNHTHILSGLVGAVTLLLRERRLLLLWAVLVTLVSAWAWFILVAYGLWSWAVWAVLRDQ